MSEKNKDITKKIILILITLFGLFTIIASGGGSSSSSVTKENKTEDSESPENTEVTPAVSIISPSDGAVYNSGSFITFFGNAYDHKGLPISGSNLIWTSSQDDHLGNGNLLNPKYLSDGTHEITLIANDAQGNLGMAKIKFSLQEDDQNTPPHSVFLRLPYQNAEYNSGDLILFEGTAEDLEDGNLSGKRLKWFSNIDKELGEGGTLIRDDLSGGTHTITLIAEDSKGLQAFADPVTITIKNTRPEAKITYPQDGSSFNLKDTITFNGEGWDNEDGELYGSELKWRSNVYGNFGQGRDLAINFLPIDTHTITLTVTDKNGAVDTDDITITIN
ncbi:MAG: hypothetical protein RBR53_01180 [Desulforegulaceae bacterium]|nr:hypothetical protein [Desulforegulaceae bacterium]